MIEKKEFTKLTLFWEFFKIGIFTIGGGMAMIPLISRIAVEKKKWLSEEEMLDCIAISQVVPGVIAINIATYVGYKKEGVKGGMSATLGVILPSFLIILMLINMLNVIEDSNFVQGALIGVKACVTGLIACVAYNVGKQTLKEWFHWVLAIMAFALVVIFNINAIIIVLLAGILGLIYYSFRKSRDIEEGELAKRQVKK